MFIIFLKFSGNKAKAPQFMDGHKEWIKNGLSEGIFLLVGSLQPSAGGGILAHNISRPDLEKRVQADPFVAQNIVDAEIFELSPAQADPRLAFLLG